MKGKSDSTPVDPDIEIGGLKIWIHGREFPNAQDYWDGNWLVATAEYGETSSFRVQGPILHLGEIAHLLRDCERLCLTLEGAAVLDCIEPYLFVELVAADGLGDVSATFSLSRDLKESQVYQENLNRTSVVRIVDACRRILNLYNVRGAIGAGASNQWLEWTWPTSLSEEFKGPWSPSLSAAVYSGLATPLNRGVRQAIISTVTSDGISTDDWSLVHELALEVVNLSAAGDVASSDAAAVRLLSLLDTLQEKYGPLPSLLATRADYVDSPVDREYLLLKAYDQARILEDLKNLVSISESLASFYIEHRSDARNGAHWLRMLEEHLQLFNDPLEAEEAVRLREILNGQG